MTRPLLAALTAFTLAAQQPSPQTPTFRAESNLVVVNVMVRDRDGRPMRGLTRDSFRVFEDGKPQQIAVFDFQEIDATPLPSLSATEPARAPDSAPPSAAPPAVPSGSARFDDRRLLVLFFDMASMQPPEQLRAVEAAEKFLREQMTAADLVSIVSFRASLNTDQEFTSDRDTLFAALKRFRIGEGSEFATEGNTETQEQSDDDASAFAADETEFNVFNTDSRLSALEQQAAALAAIPEKKAIVYFSAGAGRTGSENDSQLRSTVNAAVRANVSFYPVDVRGLVALPPGGDASQAAPGGSGLFSGRAQRQQGERLQAQQETLDTLAADTGGKALLDSNELTDGIRQAQRDIESYYTLGYYSTNAARDGRQRKIRVELVEKISAKLEYRTGYYAAKEFRDFTRTEKERQLEDALLLGDPVTELPLALEVNWFRVDGDRYFVPLAVKIPGSAVPLRRQGSAETTEFDFIGEVRDARGARVMTVRDAITIKLRDENAGRLPARSLLYDTGFTLAAGEYRLKLLVRENQTGKMGTFEMPFRIPAGPQQASELHASSVVLSSQRESMKAAIGTAGKSQAKLQKFHPLVREGEKLIPSVTRVFRTGQPLFIYAEVYDPAVPAESRNPDVAAELSFFRNGKLALATTPAQVSDLVPGRRRTAAIRAQAPLEKLAPGEYTLQLSIFDRPGAKFTFRRAKIVVLPARS